MLRDETWELAQSTRATQLPYVFSHTHMNTCKTMLNYTIGHTALKNKLHYFSGFWKINHFLLLIPFFMQKGGSATQFSFKLCIRLRLLSLRSLRPTCAFYLFFFFNLQLWRETVRGEIFIFKCFSGSDTSLHPFFWCFIARIYHTSTPQSLEAGKV